MLPLPLAQESQVPSQEDSLSLQLVFIQALCAEKKKMKRKLGSRPPAPSSASYRERKIPASSFPHSGAQRCLQPARGHTAGSEPGLWSWTPHPVFSAHGTPASRPVAPSPPLHLLFLTLSSRPGGAEEVGLMFPEASYMPGTLPSSHS